MRYPRITFGIIVLNGEPFTRYCLRSLYKYAHEIIVVEGGHEDAWIVTTEDGHSTDGTLETLFRFKQEEDPENKVTVVSKNGFWPKKNGIGDWRTLQSQAYAQLATGDYLWQVDIDEFYRPNDIEAVLKILVNNPAITAVSFATHTFWGSPAYTSDSWYLRRGGAIFQRLFKWGLGYKYIRHEPPTVIDESGRDLLSINSISGRTLAKQGLFMYHYSLLLPQQVCQKVKLYQNERPEVCDGIDQWANNNYFHLDNPYRVHNVFHSPSWIQHFNYDHPPEIMNMWKDINEGRLNVDIRPTDDIEYLLRSKNYKIGQIILKCFDYIDRIFLFIQSILPRIIRLSAK